MLLNVELEWVNRGEAERAVFGKKQLGDEREGVGRGPGGGMRIYRYNASRAPSASRALELQTKQALPPPPHPHTAQSTYIRGK